MIRRKKEDVLKELPEKERSFVPLELSNKAIYEQAEANFIDYIRQMKGNKAAQRASRAEQLAEIETLKQVAVKGKMKATIQWIKDFLNSEEKLVVFATHKETISMLMDEFSDIAVKIDGSTTGNRKDIEQKFQKDPGTRLFIGNIDAAGTGLTLTAASNVAILELPWTPGKLEQAIDRVHRIGQKGNVVAHFLLALNTIEQTIAGMLDKKRRVVDSAVDGKETSEGDLLNELIENYIN
jgi:SNF2 family DNA or RNA helicase